MKSEYEMPRTKKEIIDHLEFLEESIDNFGNSPREDPENVGSSYSKRQRDKLYDAIRATEDELRSHPDYAGELEEKAHRTAEEVAKWEAQRIQIEKRCKKMRSVALLIQIGAFISLIMVFISAASVYYLDGADIALFVILAIIQLVSVILICIWKRNWFSGLGLLCGFFNAFLIAAIAFMADSYDLPTVATGFGYLYVLGTVIAAIIAIIYAK